VTKTGIHERKDPPSNIEGRAPARESLAERPASEGGPYSAPRGETGGRIPELDGLRGLAILMVILCHYVGVADSRPLGFWAHRFLAGFSAGWSGVDLFFVLSGFLIGGILLDARKAPHYFRAFYVRRVFRILPIYYLWTLLYVIATLVALAFFPGWLRVARGDLVHVPVQLFFLRDFFMGGMPSLVFTWFVVTWSLAVEEQFYLVAPPLIRFLSPRALAKVLVATIWLAPVLRYAMIRYWNWSADGLNMAYYSMPARADALACGVLLAMAWRRPEFRQFLRQHPRLLQSALLILVLGACAFLPWFTRPVGTVTLVPGLSWLAALYSCLLLVVLSQTEGWIAGVFRWKALHWLGGISYCVYLLHYSFDLLAHRILLRASPEIYDVRGVLASLLALALTFGAATLSWRYFEKPLIRRGHGYSYGESAAESSPAGFAMDRALVQR
jgi:peptidoglycan/LPS O-acetylase OafA/YrhL